VVQELPPELKDQVTDTKGEASLKGHLANEAGGDEGTGSQAYVPPEAKDDKQLQEAIGLLDGKQANSAFPPNPKAAVPN